MKITKDELFAWCDAQAQEQLTLLKTLAAIPAPSHHEEKRAEYIRAWLLEKGAENATIDAAKNVVLPLGDGPCLAVMAHTDVVFPDTTPLPVREENGILYAPGVGDDTANVVALMLCAKFFLTFPQLLPEPLLIVFNSCEEGLGNLKGVRQIMQDYSGQIHGLVSFDLGSDQIISQAVGSERWQIRVSTQGGHSFCDFGEPNAIDHLARLISRLYTQKVPEKENCVTTYNAGLISGGTSVNTIAQTAELTYEYRSNDQECLAIMAAQFQKYMEEARCPGVAVSAENLGVRPCGSAVPEEHQNRLLARCRYALRQVYASEPPLRCASTDANIPLSLGIPAAVFGLYRGGGAHTREEYVYLDSLTPGLKIAMSFFLWETLSGGSIDIENCP